MLITLIPFCPFYSAYRICSWLYCLFLAIDANFRMVRSNVSNEEKDPSLSPGWSYFVAETAYKEVLDSYNDHPPQVSNSFI